MADAGERPPHLPRLEPGSVFAGYRIDGVLARGGMGVVYRASDPDLDRVVALKIIAPEYAQDDTMVARFKAEARAAAALEHPNIVPIHRGGESEGVLYLAMRMVDGTSLRDVIARGPMDLDRVARIVSDVANALDAAHERGLVHRDVKPANILLSADGREHVYLSDFGLAKRFEAPVGLTRTGAVVGTPDYVAPEQIQGHPIDGRTDVYALGCVVYEMLTGHVAYRRPTDMAKLWAHVSDPPPSPRAERAELVPAFDAVVSRATAKDPDDRFPTAGALAAALRDAVAQQHGRERGGGADETVVGDAAELTRDEIFLGEGAAPPAREPPAGAVAGAPPARPAAPAAAAAGAPGAPAGRGAGAPPPRGGGGDRPARRRGPLVVLGVLLTAGVVAAAALLLTSGSDEGGGAKGEEIAGDLGAVPTNRVRASGNTVVRLNGNVATVTLDADGLLDGAPHAMHFHAGGKGQCPPASAARPHNGKRTIATLDGAPFYGPAVTALTLEGNTDPKRSLLAFPRYPKSGATEYEREIDVGPAVASSLRQRDVAVVIHGIDYNGNGVYDGNLDRSDLNRSLPGEATAPALCGRLVPERGASADAGALVLTATLTVRGAAASALHCVLGPPPAGSRRRTS